MDESILVSVKKQLGIDASYDDFDSDIVMSINSAIHTLYQVGYRPAKDFIVEDTEQTWSDLAGTDVPKGIMSLIKVYIYAKVRMLFDPPTSSFVLTSLENQTKEFEWRIYAEMEGGFANDEEDPSEDVDCGCKPDPEPEPDDSDEPCGGHDPWEGVPGNGPDESEGLPDTLRRLRNEVGRP